MVPLYWSPYSEYTFFHASKIPSVDTVKVGANAKTFPVGVAHDVAWMSRREGIKTLFDSKTQNLDLQQTKEHYTSLPVGVVSKVLNVNS